MELWKGLYFYKPKWNQKVLFFGSKYSKLRNNVKYNSNKKIKLFAGIHVSDKFDIWFWFCWWMNSSIFDKVNSKGYWECLIVIFCCVWLWMSFRWDIYLLMNHNLLLWVICMMASYCLLIYWKKADRISSHNFEVEVEYNLQVSGRNCFWWTVMHVNICQVILGVSIRLD